MKLMFYSFPVSIVRLTVLVFCFGVTILLVFSFFFIVLRFLCEINSRGLESA